jgi:protein-S-isoprenylcysteine O-methyltransferase Ste14
MTVIVHFCTIVVTLLICGVLLVYIPLQVLCLDSLMSKALRFLVPYGGVLFFVIGSTLSFSAVYYLIRRGGAIPSQFTPPQRLVVAGPYAYFQHPALLGILTILFGEALWLRSLSVGAYATLLAMLSHIYVIYVEEPQLSRRFGSDYRAYRRAVPRWFPQLIVPEEDDENR